MEEVRHSIAIIQKTIVELPAGPVESQLTSPSSAEGFGWCEGTRGSTYYCVHFDRAGRLARDKVKSPSFSNWRVFPFTVHDTNMMDYAINEASFGLTIAGCDR
jgi:Ni,Fe-hydrogenase III large subunit